VGGVQPDLLAALADAAGRADGFLDRLLWAYPDAVADRWTTEGMDPGLGAALEARARELRALEPGVGPDGEPMPVALALSAAGQAAWAGWYARHAAMTAAADFPARLRGAWAKLPARLALILALLDEPRAREVGVEAVQGAIALVEYFQSHARRVYRELPSVPE